jgi:Domain of unknown function (DUF4926)
MNLHEVVELAVDLLDEDLPAGTVGTVVHIFDKPNRAYEVEFTDGNGRTIATAALTDDQIRYAGA